MSDIKKLGILDHSSLRPISTGLCQKIEKRAHPNGPPITVYMTPWSFCHELATCLLPASLLESERRKTRYNKPRFTVVFGEGKPVVNRGSRYIGVLLINA